MYPVSLGYEEAKRRILKLVENGHHAESLVTTTFTVEKILRRTLKQLVISSGFTSSHADRIVGNFRGFDSLKSNWDLYDPHGEKLTSIISDRDWKTFKESSEMRNQLVHGLAVYNLEKCHEQTGKLMAAMDSLKTELDRRYGFSGWSKIKKRLKPSLHHDPKIQAPAA